MTTMSFMANWEWDLMVGSGGGGEGLGEPDNGI